MKQVFNFSNWYRLRKLLPGLILLPQLSLAQSANVVISQVYGGGGSAATSPTPAFKQDYVELFNRSTTTQAIGGYTLQYGSAAGTGAFDVSTVIPAGTTIQGGKYFLVALGTTATSTGATLPAPDFTPVTTLNLSAAAGKVALVNGTTPLLATSSATGPTVIDFVGYGTLTGTNRVTMYEGSGPAPALSTILADFRRSSGCDDTNQNNDDFVAASPAPHNSAQALNACGNMVLVANPSALTFSATTGQVANTATYTLAGFNLAPNTDVNIGSTNAAVLVSTTGAAGSFASTATVMTNSSGDLTQTITVQFTAPTAAGTTTATISNIIGNHTALISVTGSSIVAYTWNGSSTSFNNATSWTPARTVLDNSDVLLFNGATVPAPTVVLDYVSAQTIGQLQFINNVAAVLSTDGDRSLTLDNNLPGDDFVIRAGSTLTITNNTTAGSSGLNILLTSNATIIETAAIGGTLIFTGNTSTTNGRHTLQAASTEAIQFLSGSLFQVASTYAAANPFGSSTANANSVIFRNGARLEQYGGANPFGATAPASVLELEPGSTFLFGMPSGQPSLGGRTYGTLLYDVNGTSTASSVNSQAAIQGDLIIRNGTVSINGTGSITVAGNTQVANAASFTLGTTGMSILQGNVQVDNTATLAFTPASAAVVQLSGTTNQTLGGTSMATTPISFNAATTLVINNAAGVTLGLPITLPGKLQLTSGLLTTTATNSLTLAADAMGGSNTSFVNGPVLRPVSTIGTYTFPIGKSISYRPLTLNVTAQNGTAYYRAEQFEGNPGQNMAAGSGLTRVSIFRSFTITPFASAAAAAAGMITQPTGFTGTATLSFGSNDGVTDPAATTFVVGKRADSNQLWSNSGRSGNTASTLTSGAFTTFSDFVLASTDPNPNPNPLPITLTSFTATRQASGAVQVRWVTASEQHSAYFEVQRSPDGRTFGVVDKVAAQGTTTQAHTYASLDAQAPAAQLYYRLRQVDTDGTESFSPIVPIAATEAAATLLLYPNPAHDYLTLAAGAGEAVQVLDLTGRVLQTTTLPASGQLRVEALPAGTYLLRVPLGGQPRVLRFTKE